MDKLYAIEYNVHTCDGCVIHRDVFDTEAEMFSALAFLKQWNGYGNFQLYSLIKEKYKL